ncbi:ricin-type beta-trefoil lectin domain protein [Streptomyces sp. NPDC001070]
MPPHPDPRDPEVLDGAAPRFADTFARRPSLPHRRLLPDRRAWSVLAATSAVIGCAVLVVPLMARIDVLPDGSGKGDPVAAAAPSASQSGVLPASPGTNGSKSSPAAGGNVPPASGSQGRPNGGGSAGGTGTGGGLPAVGGAPGSSGGSGSSGGGGSATGGSGGSSASGSGSSASQPTPSKTQETATVPGVRIRSSASGRCIAVSGAKDSPGRDGARLQIQTCDDGAWQKWDFRSDGTIRAFGMCMDLANAAFTDGTVVQLARCNGGWAQQFRLNTSNDLTNKNKCVDVVDKGTASGTPLQLWTCYGTNNQKWYKS